MILDFDADTTLTGAIVDVCGSRGKATFKTIGDDELRLDDNHRLAFEFVTARAIADLEVRLTVSGSSEGCFKGLTIARAAAI